MIKKEAKVMGEAKKGKDMNKSKKERVKNQRLY